MAKKVTMDDIARSLNVSKSLVSRALANKYGVNDDTRFKILLEATRMGYVFNNSRSKSTSRIDSVTVVMLYALMNENSYMSTVLEGIEEALSRKNISCKLKFLEMDENNVDYPVPYWRLDSSGIIVLGYITDQNLLSLSATGYPIVLADVQNETMLNFDKVMVNNYYGGYTATQYLLQQGMKRLMYVGASDVGAGFSERFRGFQDCLKLQGDSDISYECVMSPAPGREPVNMEELTDRLTNRELPEAIFCANDTIAERVLQILKEQNVKVPEEVSVMGFDNDLKAAEVDPPLSSIGIPRKEIGRKAVEMLLKRIDNPDAAIEFVQLNTSIVERQSVRIKNQSVSEISFRKE